MANPEALRIARLRPEIVKAVRAFYDERGFLEVETPTLHPIFGGGYARPFTTHYNEIDADVYLRIATELYLKRLVVGGLERVYEIGRVFRNESVSFKHAPESTMLETYQAYADYLDVMEQIQDVVKHAALASIGTTEVTFRGTLPRPRQTVAPGDDVRPRQGGDRYDRHDRLVSRRPPRACGETGSQGRAVVERRLVDRRAVRQGRARTRSSSRRSSATTRSRSRRSPASTGTTSG